MNNARPLERAPEEGMVAGVCAGIAAFLGWDKTLVRVVYALTSLLSVGFPGVAIYLVLWFVMPVRKNGW